MTGEEGPAVIEAVLWSVHPIDDYGIYEAAYSALRDFPRAEFGRVAAEVAPAWLARHADVDRLGIALLEVAYDDEAQAAFIEASARWDAAQRTAMTTAIESWNREEEGWEPVLAALGRVAPTNDFDPIPADWPASWRTAAEAFRSTGAVNRAWADERDLPANFDRVLALLELGHGARWREVTDFLNPLFLRRRDQLPAFVRALAALPEPRRERVLAAVHRSRPDAAERLRQELAQL
ncbi:MAG: hypothetical protein QM804_02290 [Propionicimonas sp.]